MKRYRLALLFVFSIALVACWQDSHIEANVPNSENFDTYLKRDLTSYFCLDRKDCEISYEFLRTGPTQSGVSYPKYYLWVKCLKNCPSLDVGAVRVAAIERESFDVTNFLSRKEILESRSQVASIFPAPLVDKIIQKASEK